VENVQVLEKKDSFARMAVALYLKMVKVVRGK
jgi:hypothetical protein